MIREIKWHNHKILGNLELNFTKPDGTPYNTIVLAGENGVGKTTILETLATFLNLETMEPFEYIKYIVDGIPYTISPEGDLGKYGFHSRKMKQVMKCRRFIVAETIIEHELRRTLQTFDITVSHTLKRDPDLIRGKSSLQRRSN